MSSCSDCVLKCEAASTFTTLGAKKKTQTAHEYLVALVGNPNTGKSTVFNELTGLHQHTGNWPGKTVARAEGFFKAHGQHFRIVDLPGTYSLLANSVDEEIARDFVLFSKPQCTIVVCDSTMLERNLQLVLQVIEITDRVVVCLNLLDEANRKGISIDAGILATELGVPVIATTARSGNGLSELVDCVYKVCSGALVPKPLHRPLDSSIEPSVVKLSGLIQAEFPQLHCSRWIALRLLEGDARIEKAMCDGTLGRLAVSEIV